MSGRSLLLVVLVGLVFPEVGVADQASQPSSVLAGDLGAGKYQSCVVLRSGGVRCWGYGGDGTLGYGNQLTIGDDETPGSAGPVDLGVGRTATAISTGGVHTCGLLDDGSVRCWGFGGNGRLGYGNTSSIGATQTPGSVGTVDLGPRRTAKAISAGGAHTCVILDDDSVRCWGFGIDGRLGYGNTSSVGDVQTPGSVGPVDLGAGRTAKAISAGGFHTCAILDDNTVRCWGFGASGRLGYGNTTNVGDMQTPGSVGPVDLGVGRTAKAISAGGAHTCAILDDNTVRCWGFGGNGQLGYGNTRSVGAVQTPGAVGPVDLGVGRTALAISAGANHTCAVLDDRSVRCWGYGANGQLGYANNKNVGDTQTPGTVGPVDLGPGRSAQAIVTGNLHTCALLDDRSVRCWGYGANGRLGYCNENNVGDTQPPGTVGPIDIGEGSGRCTPPPAASPTTTPPPRKNPPAPNPLAAQARRQQALRSCLRKAANRRRARNACLKRYAATPGKITLAHAQPLSRTTINLSFNAPGSDHANPPAAHAYLIKQSRHPIRGARDFLAAQTLCNGYCRFKVTLVGTKIKLTITHLRPHTPYYYAIAARDNLTGKPGPHTTLKTRTK